MARDNYAKPRDFSKAGLAIVGVLSILVIAALTLLLRGPAHSDADVSASNKMDAQMEAAMAAEHVSEAAAEEKRQGLL